QRPRRPADHAAGRRAGSPPAAQAPPRAGLRSGRPNRSPRPHWSGSPSRAGCACLNAFLSRPSSIAPCTPSASRHTAPMRLPVPLLRGTLIQRYKRFLADVRLEDGRLVTALCPNTGSMLGLITPGVTVWLSISDAPGRKYPFTWELVEADLGKGPTLVGINTAHPNKLIAQALEARRIKA